MKGLFEGGDKLVAAERSAAEGAALESSNVNQLFGFGEECGPAVRAASLGVKG